MISILQEIDRVGQGQGSSSELETLRVRKMELEMRLNELQQTRKDLMTELEELMKVLKVQGTMPVTHQSAKFHKVTRNQTINLAPAQLQMRQYPAGGGQGVVPGVGSFVRSPDNSETDSAAASNSLNSCE